MSNIQTNLENLTPEELQKVSNLIEKFASRKEESSDEKPQKKRRRRKKPKKRVDEPEQEVIIEHGQGRNKPRQRIVLPDEPIDPNEKRVSGRGRTEPRNPRNQRAQSVRRGRGKGPRMGRGNRLARTESVNLSGENKFDTMRERNQAKADTKIDKALWANREASQRPDKFEYAEVQCLACKLWFDIQPNLVMIDEDTGVPNFTCNNCSRRGN